MSMIRVTILFILALLPTMSSARGGSSSFASSNMDKNCGTTITLNGDTFPGTFFSLSSGNYAKNMNCLLTIKAPTNNQRIVVTVEKMDVACGGDSLIIYDGKVDQSTILNKNDAQQCGTSKYYYRTVNSNTVIIKFISNGDAKVGSGFIINTAINFPVASCSRNEGLYRCKNNYCISNLFNCDGTNWCGDNTQKEVCR